MHGHIIDTHIADHTDIDPGPVVAAAVAVAEDAKDTHHTVAAVHWAVDMFAAHAEAAADTSVPGIPIAEEHTTDSRNAGVETYVMLRVGEGNMVIGQGDLSEEDKVKTLGHSLAVMAVWEEERWDSYTLLRDATKMAEDMGLTGVNKG